MNTIRLASGQSHEVSGSTFIARLQISLSDNLNFEVDTPKLQSNRRGAMVAVRNPEGNTEITVSPDHSRTEFPTGTKLFVSLIIGSAGSSESKLELPTFEVGGLRSFPVLRLFPGTDSVRVQAGEASSDGSLDAESVAVRAALRRSLDRDNQAEREGRDVTVLVDVTASMRFSTYREALDAMFAFATGVLTKVSGDPQIRLLTSSGSNPVEILHSLKDFRSLGKRDFITREVGWNVDLSQIDPDSGLLVISDDLPAEVLNFPGGIHLLSSRQPLVDHGIGVTVFTPQLIKAVKEQDTLALSAPSQKLYEALTREESDQ